MDITSALIGQYVSFNVHPSTLLGNGFQRVKVLAILDGETAALFTDIYPQHAAVYPTLPPGVQNDPLKYSWVKIQFENGGVQVLGIPWVDSSTVTVVTATDINVIIRGAAVEDIPLIRNAINAAGFNTIEISTLG